MSILERSNAEPGRHPAAATPSALASVLVIDNEEIVGNTLCGLLKAEGFDAVMARSGGEGVELLRGRQFDVVIADLLMPGMNGLRTIAALKEVDPDVKVIILTGHATVDSTIAALRQGACDFLLKPIGMAQLRPALMRALEVRRIALDNARLHSELSHQAEELDMAKGQVARAEARARAVMETAGEAVARAEARGRAVMETAQEAIVILDKEGVVWDLNPKAMEMLSRRREQAVGRNLADFALPPRLRDGFKKHLETAYREGKDPPNGCLEVYALRENGEEFLIEISTAVIETPQGKLLSTFAREITDRKRAERATQESEAKLQAIFDAVRTAIFVIDPETHRIMDANPVALEWAGATRERVVGSVCHPFVCTADAGHCPSTDLGQMADESERILLTATGEKRAVIKTIRPVVINGRKLLLESFVDITAHKQAEKALGEAEEHFRSLFASIPLPTFFFDAESLQYLEVNDAAVSASGYSRDELLRMRVVDLASPEIAHRVVSKIQALRPHYQEHSEGRYRLKDGRLIDVESDFRSLDFRGKRAVLSVSQDVTARKRAEGEMAERHRLASLLGDVGVVLTRAESLSQGLQQCAEILVRNIGAAFARVWTVKEEENVLELQASAGMYTHIDGGHARVPMGRFKIGRIAETGQPHLTNSVPEDPWVGDPEWARREGMVAFAGYPLKVEERVLGVVAAFARQPFTEVTLQALAAVADNTAQFIKRKRAEEALRENEDRYRDLVENSFVLIGTHDSKGRFLSLNRALAHLLEATNAEEIVGRSLTDYVPPDLLPRFDEYLETILCKGHAEGLMVIATPNGKRKIVEYQNTLRRQDPKEPIIRCMGRDVTDRIQAEEALRASESRYRLLFERNLAGVLCSTRKGRILDCNESLARMLGYDSPQELIDAEVGQIWDDPNDRERMIAELSEHASLSNYEVRYRRKDGKPVWALLNIQQSGREGGEDPLLEGTAVDITQRKQAEERLLLAQFSIDHASDAITWLDSQGRIVYVNEETCRSLGRSRKELLSLTVADIDPDFPREAWEREWERVKAAGPATFEARHITKLGQVFPVEVTTSYQVFGGKDYLFTFARDITRRKEAERQINLQVTALKAAANGIVITDQKGQILWANPAFTRLTGYEAGEVVGRTPSVLKSGNQDKSYYEALWRTIMSGAVWQGELVNRRKDGTLYTEEMTITPVRSDTGAITHFIAIKQDVTARKRAEEELLLKTALLEAMAETTIDGILVVDKAGHVLQANKRFAEIWNLPESLINTNDDAKFLEHVVNQVMDPVAFLERVKYLYAHESERTREEIELKDGRVFDRYSSPLQDPKGKDYGRIWYFRDITEGKRAEEALRVSESRFRRLTESNLFGIFIGGEDGCIKEANAAFLAMLDYTGEDLRAGMIRWDLLTPPEYKYVNERIYRQLITSGFSSPMEVEYFRKDGSRLPAMTGLVALDASANKAIGFVLDQTERKQAEEKVRESNELVSLLLNSIPEAVYGIDMQGKCTFCNPSCLKLLGYREAADLLGKDMHTLVHHTRQDGTPYPMEECHIYEAFRRGQGTHINDEVLWRRDGSNFPGEYWSHPIHRNGDVIGTVVTFVDITERKQAEQKTRLQTAALESAANGIAIADQEGCILWVNPAFTRLTGYSAAEILGQTLRVLKSGDQDADFYRDLWQTILAGKVWQGELVNRRKDGTLYTDDTTITPVRDASGAVTHFVAIKQDVTGRRRSEQALQEQTAYLNTLFQISPLGIVVIDTEGCIQMSNSAFEKLFLYSRQEIAGAKLDDFIVPEDLVAEAKSLTGLCLSGPGAFLTSCRRRKDGTIVDVEIYGVPLVIEGELRGVLALYQDITERVRAEADLVKYAEDLEVSRAAQEEHAQELARLIEELALERDLLGTLMDSLPDNVYLKDRQSRFLRTNPATAKVLGLSDPHQAVGKTDFDFFPEEDAKVYFSDEQQVIEAGQPLISRMERTRQPDGQYRWFSTSKVPIRDTQGRVTGLVGIGRDMTEHMETEEKIRESETNYRSLVSNIPDVVWTIDSGMRIAFLSPNIERLSGFSLEEHCRSGSGLFLENIHPEDVGKVKEGMEALFAKGEPYDVECRVRRKDGEWIWVHDRAVATYEKNGVRYADGLLTDISPSKRAEETLRASEERYRELFENASDLVYTTGLDTRLTSLNMVGQQILGYSEEEATQLTLAQVVAPKHWGIVDRGRERVLAGESDLTMEVEVIAKDGRAMMLEVKPRLIYRGGKPIGVQGIGRDITGRDEAELELRHAQKLESVGRLASGIAHEINTPIQFVGDNTRFLQDSFGGLQALLTQYQELRDAADSGAVSRELLAKVRDVEEESDCAYLLEEIPKALAQTLDGVTRVATIVRAMKEFAHPEGKEMAAADLNRALLSTLTVARNELKYVADVETEFGDLPLVVCNIGDLNQVFLNLLVNAAHAIGESAKGTGQKGKIRVCTLSEGSHVLVTISDSGCGIPEANRTKVFDPFFTTKEVGRGTGQGLAIARSVVVDRHKGALTFESDEGKGTTFYVRLPVDPGECSKEVKVP
jgi:PAS domain S-box-containing protein